jgi:hypothetical protein
MIEKFDRESSKKEILYSEKFYYYLVKNVANRHPIMKVFM